MEKDIENKSNVILHNFKSEDNVQLKKPVKSCSNQTNPIYKHLLKLTHTEIIKHKSEYKSFSNFKPEDLR